MRDFEILNRASAFLVRSNLKHSENASNKIPFPFPKVHLLTASHVVAPWKWPKYYPEEWLQHVCEKHTTYTAEVRHSDGVFATQSDLKPVSYHHPTRDLAVLHFENELEVLELMDSVGVDILSFTPNSSQLLKEGDILEFHGHQIAGGDITADSTTEDDVRKSMPRTSSGIVQGRTQHQIFAKTNPVLSQGMCGGPVIVRDDRRDPLCVGLVEGIVPREHPTASLQELAVFVESAEMQSFLDDIETGKVQPLIGGHSISIVSQDQEGSSDLGSVVDGVRSTSRTTTRSNFQKHP